MNNSDADQPGQPLDEAGYLAVWQSHGLAQRPPWDAAFEGGLLADQLAWVFVAGYQAAVRAVFDEVDNDGWLAFAVSENRDAPEDQPPLQAVAEESEYLLTGCKNWIAQSRSVSELIVTAKFRERTELFRVASDIKGLTLTHREAPGFLAAMSQGFARFDASPCARLDAPERRRAFLTAEALAMMLAATGYLQRYTPLDNPQARAAFAQMGTCVAPLRSMLEQVGTVDPQALAQLDTQWQEALQDWCAAMDLTALPGFTADQSLLTMYRPAIARRAADAAITVSEPSP